MESGVGAAYSTVAMQGSSGNDIGSSSLDWGFGLCYNRRTLLTFQASISCSPQTNMRPLAE